MRERKAIDAARYIVEHEVRVTYSEFLRNLRNIIEEYDRDMEQLRSERNRLREENRTLRLSRDKLEVGYKKQSKEIMRLERIIEQARVAALKGQ